MSTSADTGGRNHLEPHLHGDELANIPFATDYPLQAPGTGENPQNPIRVFQQNLPSAVRQISQYLSFTSAIAVTDQNLEQDRGHVSIWRKALYDGFMASRHAAAT